MSLPKLVAAKFISTLSDGTQVEYRPFTVKEEKILLMANESGDQETMIRAIRDTVDACTDVKASILPFFDVEKLFLDIRSKSVSEEVKYSYRHKNGKNREGADCTEVTEVVVNLEDVKVQTVDDHPGKKFMIDDTYGVIMNYPTLVEIEMLAAKKIDEMGFMARCIESIYDANQVFQPDNDAEALRFIEEMNMHQYEKFSKFFETLPELRHTVTYHCNGCGQADTVTFEGVSDFF